jgi:serine/threonine-protein kinase
VIFDGHARRRDKEALKAWLLNPLTLMLAAVAVAAIAFAAFRKPAAPSGRVVRFVIAASDSSRPPADFYGPWPAAISRDGDRVVYVANGGAGPVLYSLRTDQVDARPIPGTNGANQPVFSPDGEWICFEAQGKVNKVRLDGSEPIPIATGGNANGADWTTLDEIILGSERGRPGLSRFSSAGGDPIEFVKPDKTKGETDYLWPIAFPDGKAVVFAVWTGRLTTAMLALASVDGGDVAYLGIRGIRPLAIVDGKLIYVQADGAVMGVAIDESRRKVTGRPVLVHDPVFVFPSYNGNSSIFVSAGGALIASRGGLRSQLSWIARDGRSIPIAREARTYTTPRLSPDGRRIAVAARDRETWSMWIYDIETGTFSRPSSAAVTSGPSWSSTGSTIFYVGGEKDRLAIWSQQAEGGAPPTKVTDVTLVSDLTVAPDGRSLVYAGYHNATWDLFQVRLDSAPIVKSYLASSDADELQGRFSPDGRWFAAISTESGVNEVYVFSYPIPSLRVQVSTGGALWSAWSPDGSSVYYVAGNVLMSAKISTSPSLRVVARDTVLKDVSALTNGYDVAKDGRFLGLVSQKNDYQLVVVPNWKVELEQKFAAAEMHR